MKNSNYWQPVSLDGLLKNYGVGHYKTILVLLTWIGLIGLSVFAVLKMTPGSWVLSELDDNDILMFFLFYPPLLIGGLLFFWFGFEWGFIPVFIASFAIAFSASMPVSWALLFAFSFVLGLGIYALAYHSVPVDMDLRSIKSFAFFTVVSLIAAMASSLGSFVWSLEQGLTSAQSTIIWNGWWTGAFFQSLLILGPLLLLFTPGVLFLRNKVFKHEKRKEVTLKWVYGAISSVVVVISLFVIGGKILGTKGIREALAQNPAAYTENVLKATESFQVIFWISLGIILIVGLTGIYLVSAWNRSLQEEVDEKTGMLKQREAELELAVKDRDLLLNEIHGRVKNNLSIILAVFELQLRNTGEDSFSGILKNSKFRIRALSLIHELLSQSGSFKNLNLKSYVSKLSNRLEQDYRGLKTETEIQISAEDLVLNIERAVSVCMVLNEVVSRIYEQVYANTNSGRVHIDLYSDYVNSYIVVRTKGDFPQKFFKWDDKGDLGVKLIYSLIRLIKGEVVTGDHQNSIAIHFPLDLPVQQQDKPEADNADNNKVHP
ncbi:MAG: sensor histidine kinase [Balneolaceae bacterium]